jgi:hypothetical protein
MRDFCVLRHVLNWRHMPIEIAASLAAPMHTCKLVKIHLSHKVILGRQKNIRK